MGYYLTHSYMYRNECHLKEKRKGRRNLRIKKENDLGLQEHFHQNFSCIIMSVTKVNSNSIRQGLSRMSCDIQM